MEPKVLLALDQCYGFMKMNLVPLAAAGWTLMVCNSQAGDVGRMATHDSEAVLDQLMSKRELGLTAANLHIQDSAERQARQGASCRSNKSFFQLSL